MMSLIKLISRTALLKHKYKNAPLGIYKRKILNGTVEQYHKLHFYTS